MLKLYVVLQSLIDRAQDDNGVTAIEYGLIAALVAVALLVGAGALGTNLNGLFGEIATKIPTGF